MGITAMLTLSQVCIVEKTSRPRIADMWCTQFLAVPSCVHVAHAQCSLDHHDDDDGVPGNLQIDQSENVSIVVTTTPDLSPSKSQSHNELPLTPINGSPYTSASPPLTPITASQKSAERSQPRGFIRSLARHLWSWIITDVSRALLIFLSTPLALTELILWFPFFAIKFFFVCVCAHVHVVEVFWSTNQ